LPDQLLQSIQQAWQRNAKSTVLKSLGWLIALLLPSTIAASHYGTDKWLVVMLAILVCISILVYIGAYVFFTIKNPDLLRSEKFGIQKMAIQHGLVGDDLSGFFKVGRIAGIPLIEEKSSDDKTKEIK
jgi:hypothetical protein